MAPRLQLHEAAIPLFHISRNHGTSRQCKRPDDHTAVLKAAKPRSFILFHIQFSGLTSAGKRPEGIKKGQKRNPLRRSPRLARSIEVHEARPGISQQPLPSPVSDTECVNVIIRLPVSEDLWLLSRN